MYIYIYTHNVSISPKMKPVPDGHVLLEREALRKDSL